MASAHLSLLLSCILILHVSGKCLNDQRSHLLQFRDALHSKSSHSTKLVHWNLSKDCCNWGGVGCDSFGHVITLELDNESISVRNEDWKSIFSLQHLEKLNLAWNNFYYVKFPVELCNLTSLKYLNFLESDFTGQIPIGLSRMTSLVTLDLSIHLTYQGLQVKHPGGLKALFQNLTQLREIHLDGNKLSTIVPEFFANFTNLMALSLDSCGLHGQVPEKIFQATTLESLVLSNNYLLW